MSNVLEMFSYSFIIRAFIVGVLISLCASLIGVSLVLKKNSMIGDGLSHVSFGAFVIATILGITPLYFAIPVVLISSFLILKIDSNSKINEDAKIAVLSSSSLAIGTFLVSIKGVNTDINSYLFGSILSISNLDVIISIILSIIIIFLYVVCYNKIFAITFDEKFAKSIGINTDFYNIIFSSLCSIVVVLGMRLTGSLLISSLIIFPTLISQEWFNSFKKVVISSGVISVINCIIGIILSYILETPTGASIVIVNLIILILSKLINKLRRKR